MSLHLSPAKVRAEMARRAWRDADLARAAGIGAASVVRAKKGASVAPATVKAIARAFTSVPPLDGIDLIL